MKKIVLVNVPYSLEVKRLIDINYPMGILCVGSALEKAGYEVIVVECGTTDNYNDVILSYVPGALFVGFSVMTNQIACVLETAAIIREQHPDLAFVWGGVHPTLDFETTIISPLCDIVLRGEADGTVVALAQALENGGNLAEIPGIVFKQKGDIVCNPLLPEVTDIESLASINYDLVNINDYLDYDYDKMWGFFPNEPGSVRRLTLHSARGCPFKCSFCINSLILGDYIQPKRYRAFSVDRVINDIKKYKEKYDINFISFGDDLFFADKSRVQKLISRLIAEDIDIKWYANVRADFFNDSYLNHDFLDKVERAGCIRFALGIESGSLKILNYLNKTIDPKHAIQAAASINAFNFVAGYSFMTGIPGEEDEDVYRTLCLIYMIKEIHKRSYIIGPQVYRPYPGSKLFEDCVSLGWKRPRSLNEYVDGLEIQGNYNLDDMTWVKNKWLVFEAQRYGQRFNDGTAEWFLNKYCPNIFEEYRMLKDEVLREISPVS